MPHRFQGTRSNWDYLRALTRPGSSCGWYSFELADTPSAFIQFPHHEPGRVSARRLSNRNAASLSGNALELGLPPGANATRLVVWLVFFRACRYAERVHPISTPRAGSRQRPETIESECRIAFRERARIGTTSGR